MPLAHPRLSLLGWCGVGFFALHCAEAVIVPESELVTLSQVLPRSADCSFASDFDCLCGGPSAERPAECSGQEDLRRGPGPNPDAHCSTTESSVGSGCTRDCWVACGYQRLGVKVCTCSEGRYTACTCLPPEVYAPVGPAPACATLPLPDGAPPVGSGDCSSLPEPLQRDCVDLFEPPGVEPLPCAEPWQACAGIDPRTPTNTLRGCMCLPQIDSATGEFQRPVVSTWDCGSTGGWFSR